jgi:hypothetical protein
MARKITKKIKSRIGVFAASKVTLGNPGYVLGARHKAR